MVKPLTRVKSNINLTSVLLLWLGAIVLSGIFGLTLAFGIYPLTIGFFVLIAGGILVLKPLAGTWIVIIGSLVFAGLIDLYLPALQPIKWALAGLAMGVSFVAYVFNGNVKRKILAKFKIKSSLLIILWLFFGYVILISMFSWHGVSAFLTSFKAYFQVWGILIAVYYVMDKEIDAQRLIKFLLVLGVIQLPFVFHQFFFLIPQRSTEEFAMRGMVAADVVAGTFGGTMMGGGRSSSLAILCVLGITIVLAQFKSGLISTVRALVLLCAFMLPMFLSEAKLFMVLLPIALFILYKDKLVKDPLKFIAGSIAVLLLLGAIFFAYSLIPGAESQHNMSLKEMWDSNISYNFGDRGYGNALLNRTTVYTFWLHEHLSWPEMLHMFFGHGPGETQGGVFVSPDLTLLKKYPGYGIGLTGFSTLLWELGLIGTILAVSIFVSGYKLGTNLLQKWSGTVHEPLIRSAQIGIVLFATSLLHNNYFSFDISYQALFIVILGYLVIMFKLTKFSTGK
ncbi:hypothetical protein LG200_08690 [Methylobacillus caricis]|uniref:hypothetical protein n=1 Tax=Methylobacillus caricis TaxID=1971611 RepID=UPI001D001119|nr:hypothetical protein [Methylobacillus caricis]MCB5188078.1 hypothetical protein [Methylobacillus caricis]